ncbi:MAG: pentapeptide repeat-containing protein [Gammaproteobacteria bacterium]|nr:pentapeptide repeat-containing protein [Gammaproteobacteria bacterium]
MECSFTSSSGKTCGAETDGKPYCYWHSDDDIKTEPDLVSLLEERARSGRPMRYFKLRNTNLENIDLVNRGQHRGYQLVHADLYRANLQHAHLFALDLSFSSLMKADLTGANLHSANLEYTNLLGVKLDHAKLEGVEWGDMVRQEWQGDNEPDPKKQKQLYSEAEEIYRVIGRVMRNQGITSKIGWFLYRELVVRRKQLPKPSLKRFVSWLVDGYCGYGEKPLRIIVSSLALVTVFALLYSGIGLQHDGAIQNMTNTTGLPDRVKLFINSLYFSVVTFTTLGYGDFSPVGWARPVAAIEAVIGSFTNALFVVVFVRRMTR